MEQEIRDTAMDTTTTTDSDEKPLLSLIKNLVIVSNSDSNTTVENSQLLDILTKEFGMPQNSQTDLDTEIYLNVLKKFIKTWPSWDEFDKLIKEKRHDPVATEAHMLEEYTNLKNYLQRTLDFTRTQMAPIISKITIQKAKYKMDKDRPLTGRDVVMEVSCSREQLNRLFYRKPHPTTLSIFHISEEPSCSKISLGKITFKEVLNWPHVTVSVSLPNFEFIRKNTSQIKRTLINRKLQKEENKYLQLPNTLFWKKMTVGRKNAMFRKNIIISFLVQLIKYIKEIFKTQNDDWRLQLMEIFSEIKSDLLMLNNSMSQAREYQYYLSKYPYVRRLTNTDYSVEESPESMAADKLKECINPNDFDLHLEEVISPAMMFYMPKYGVNFTEENKLGRVFHINYPCFADTTSNWLKIECNWCEVKFEGFLTVYSIVQHFNEHHSAEPDWQCTNCNKSFTMIYLAANRWLHTC